MFESLKRIIKSGWKIFSRNKGASVATCFIIVLTIYLVSSLFIFQKASHFLISNLEEKVDISVYFKEDSLEEDILKIEEELLKNPEVKEVEYISKGKALEKFTEKYKGNEALMESLRVVGGNPFLSSLSIKAFSSDQYSQIYKTLDSGDSQNIIEKISYYERKKIIDKVFSITSSLNNAGFYIILIFGLIALLVTFNTVRLTIRGSQEEIKIMRLVGASNWFIRGPFLIQGILAGIFASLIALLIFIPSIYFLSPKIEVLFPGLSIFQYFNDNFLAIILIQFSVGVILGIIPSLIAIRKYLKI